jgi:N utilization substance protein A
MNDELMALLDYWEKEKGISKETMLEAIKQGLLSAAKRSVGPARELRVDIDSKSGHIKAIASLKVVDRVTSKHDEISLIQARTLKSDVQLGELVDVEVTPHNFGRIAAQTAKQAMMQKIRQVEKEMIYDEFKDRVGEIVSGTVRRFERSDVIVDLGKFEGVIPNRERVPTEEYQAGDRLRAYVLAVENTERGPEIILSRSHPNFVKRLFELEVTEIADKTVDIKGIAREAGYRTKLAVFSNDEKVDPVGACVGMRGVRVKNIVRELNGEKVDIIRWSPEIKQYITEALQPAKIKRIELDEKNKSVHIIVDEKNLSLAIGKRGQNVRLTSKLTGWKTDIEKEEITTEGFEEKLAHVIQNMSKTLELTQEQATALVRGGMSSVDLILSGEVSDLAEIEGITPELAEKIYRKAQALENHEQPQETTQK